MNFNLLNHGIVNMNGHIYDVADVYDMFMGRYRFWWYIKIISSIYNPFKHKINKAQIELLHLSCT